MTSNLPSDDEQFVSCAGEKSPDGCIKQAGYILLNSYPRLPVFPSCIVTLIDSSPLVVEHAL